MKTPRDEYDQLTDGRNEPRDDRSADEIVLDMQAAQAKGRKPTVADFDMLVTAYNFLSARAKDSDLDECAVRMKAEGSQSLPSKPDLLGEALAALQELVAKCYYCDGKGERAFIPVEKCAKCAKARAVLAKAKGEK